MPQLATTNHPLKVPQLLSTVEWDQGTLLESKQSSALNFQSSDVTGVDETFLDQPFEKIISLFKSKPPLFLSNTSFYLKLSILIILVFLNICSL